MPKLRKQILLIASSILCYRFLPNNVVCFLLDHYQKEKKTNKKEIIRKMNKYDPTNESVF